MLWRVELMEATRASGCLDLFFPKLAPEREEAEHLARHTPGTWKTLSWDLQYPTAARILAAFVSGPLWAYMLIRFPGDDVSLLERPEEVVEMAEVASFRFSSAPNTEREANRMLYELDCGQPKDYPSAEHYDQAMEWLEAAVLLPANKEAVAARRMARYEPFPAAAVRPEVMQRPSLAGVGNSPARRRRRREAEGAPEGPEPRRIKLEP